MRDHHHPRNLRRSFGSQPVVCVGNQSWPEAGIAALVIPAQSSRGPFAGKVMASGDLAVDDHRGAGPRTHLRPQFRRFPHLQHQRRGFRLKPCFQTTTSVPKRQQLSKRLLQCHGSASFFTSKAPFTENSEEPLIPGILTILIVKIIALMEVEAVCRVVKNNMIESNFGDACLIRRLVLQAVLPTQQRLLELDGNVMPNTIQRPLYSVPLLS